MMEAQTVVLEDDHAPTMNFMNSPRTGGALEIQARIVATDVTSLMFTDTGHWLMAQRPAETKAALKKFLDQ